MSAIESQDYTEALADLFRHHQWANLRLLDACIGLNDTQLDAAAVGAYGSIRDTLRHLVGAEESYLARLTGERPTDAIKQGETYSVEELREHARRTGEALLQTVARLDTVRRIRVEWGGKVWQLPAGAILTQAINHATEHRAQVMLILTQQGIEPPEVSGWEYVIANIPAEEAE